MAFQVIEPTVITDAMMTGSNVPENDLQEWVAGTAYAVGDTVMVATSVANIHKTYECLVAQSAGLTADLLDEDCADISDWGISNLYNAITEVSPAGQFRFDGNMATFPNFTQISRTIATTPNTFTLEIKTYFDKIGTFADGDYFWLAYGNGTWKFKIEFCSDGLFVYKAAGAKGEVGADIVKCNNSAEWQSWRFKITKTTESTATVDVFSREEGGAFVSQGTVDCDYEGSFNDGSVQCTLVAQTTNNILCHIDYIRIATGLGSITNADISPVGNSDWIELGSTNRWKAFNNILGSQTEFATKIQYAFTPGVVINSLALLNLESDTVEIIEIDSGDNLIVNGENWTGASGTTPPTGWTKVDTPTDFTIDNGMLRITADGSNEGIVQQITVTPGTEYQLLGLYKNTSGDTARFLVNDKTNGNWISDLEDLPSSTTNSPFSYVFTAPLGCVAVEIYLWAKAAGDIVWYDSVKLAPTGYSEIVTTGVTKTDVVKLDISGTINSILTIIINKSDTAAIGELIVGNKTSIGSMLYSPQIGFRNYSTKTQDTFGNWTIVPRGYSKKLVCSLRMEKSTIDSVFKFLCDHKDEMLVWVGEETYNSLIVYGFCKEPQIVIPYSPWAACSLEIEGMI